MKIVLSRKGFDSGYGKIPSPIFPDGTMVSFPIPSPGNPHRMCDLSYRGHNLGKLAEELSNGRYDSTKSVHVDPDLEMSLLKRPQGWRPALGQTGSSQSHLAAHGVSVGDVFLFFGWFRQVAQANNQWRFAPGAPNLHVLFGWLQVADVLSVVTDRAGSLARYPWLSEHPHLAAPEKFTDRRNTVYVASKQLTIGNTTHDISGGGMFGTFRPELQLTAPGHSRTHWKVPRWLNPAAGRPPLSFHRSPDRWAIVDNELHLRSVAKGQEFVFDDADYPEAPEWLMTILRLAI